jgi:hypothetical protein
MLRHKHHTEPASLAQPFTHLADDWSTLIVPHLPADLAAQAARLGAFQRARAFAQPADLLRGLLAYSVGLTSFRHLGAWGVLTDLANLSAKGWCTRLRSASPWLQWLLKELLARRVHLRYLTQRLRGRIKLIDATMLARQGGSSAGWRVHVAYDLLAGQLDQVSVTNHYGAESLQYYALAPGDLVVADGGYGTRAAVAVAQAARADVVLRIHLNSFPLEQGDGRPFDALRWLQQVGSETCSVSVWCSATRTVADVTHSSRHQLRLLAWRLPAPARRAAQRQLKRKASKHGREVSQRGLMLAGWVLLITTLDPSNWSEAEIWRVYRARWQIEILFKRFKQLLRVHTLRCRTEANATAAIRALLIVWTLVEDVSAALQVQLQAKVRPTASRMACQQPAQEAVVSRWQVDVLAVDLVRQAVLGQWTWERLRRSMAELARFVVSNPRQREHQATEVVAWLTGVRWTPARPEPV